MALEAQLPKEAEAVYAELGLVQAEWMSAAMAVAYRAGIATAKDPLKALVPLAEKLV